VLNLRSPIRRNRTPRLAAGVGKRGQTVEKSRGRAVPVEAEGSFLAAVEYFEEGGRELER
jgi:hypothetical protein